MTGFLGAAWLWVKAAHIIFVIFWMAGLFILPRYLVHHQEALGDPVQAKAWADREAKLRRVILVPSMAVVWILGIALAANLGLFEGDPIARNDRGRIVGLALSEFELRPGDARVIGQLADLSWLSLQRSNVRDEELAEWKGLMQAWEREQAAKRRAGVLDPQLEEFRWLLEELRVGLFAQELKTPMPVSVKRLQKIWASRPR